MTRLGLPRKKAPANHEGLFAYFFPAWNSSIWIFSDEDLIRSRSRRNSAVSSAIDFGGGLGGNGITSDIGKTSLGADPPRSPVSCAIGAFLRHRFSAGARNTP